MFILKTQLISLLFLVAAEQPRTVAIVDLLERECAQGNQASCERVASINESLEQQKRLEAYSIAFAESVNGNEYMLDKKIPDLAAAYPVVMRDFNQQETAAGISEVLDENSLPYCGEHYHNHWINKKLWWPTREDGQPDWESIYEFIVDHYYGFCLRQE